MSKLTKNELLDHARNLARKDRRAAAQTTEWLLLSSQADLRAFSDMLASEARSTLYDSCSLKGVNADPSHARAFVDAYSQTVREVWSHRVADHAFKQRAFLRALNGITPDEGGTLLADFVRGYQLRGAQIRKDIGGYVVVEVERSRDVQCTIYFSLQFDADVKPPVENPDNPDNIARLYNLTASVSWSSTQRDARRAMLNAKLYEECAVLALEAEDMFSRINVVVEHGGAK